MARPKNAEGGTHVAGLRDALPSSKSKMVYMVYTKREGFPVVSTTEEHAQIYEARGHVKIYSNKYEAQEAAETMQAKADALERSGRKDELGLEDDGIHNIHAGPQGIGRA